MGWIQIEEPKSSAISAKSSVETERSSVCKFVCGGIGGVSPTIVDLWLGTATRPVMLESIVYVAGRRGMENILNIIHYSFYKLFYRMHIVMMRINPAMLLVKVPFIKRRLERAGVDVVDVVNRVFADWRNGVSVVYAGGLTFGLVFQVAIVSAHYTLRIFDPARELTTEFLVALGLLCASICYIYVFRGDKYLRYFAKYEKMKRKQKVKYALCTLGACVAVAAVYVLGLP